jgi:hypothetical protein
MKMHVLMNALIAAAYLLFVAVAILLVRSYRRTHAIGFIWLGVAVLVWPFAAGPVRLLIARVGLGPFDTIGQFVAFLNVSQQICGLALLLVAVLYLGRTQMSRSNA